MLVSIVVANYNGEKYLAEFIESIQKQTYKNWELFIVDDGSNDNSQNVVESYAKQDSRISFIERTNEPKGADHCRNIGLDKANGKYICFFDSDDLVPQYAITDRVREMEDAPAMDFIIFPAITFKKTPYDYNNLAIGVDANGDDTSLFLKRYRLPFAVWTNIYRTDFLKQNKIQWDNKLMSMQDSDFNLLVLRHDVKYKYSVNKRPSYFWRQFDNGGNITKSIKSVKNIESQLYFFSKLKDLYGKTQYAKDLDAFRLTLLHRTIYVKYDKNPIVLLPNNYEEYKYNFLKRIMSKFHSNNEKVSYLIFMLFYPTKLIQELCHRVRNNRIVKQYFSNYNNNLQDI